MCFSKIVTVYYHIPVISRQCILCCLLECNKCSMILMVVLFSTGAQIRTYSSLIWVGQIDALAMGLSRMPDLSEGNSTAIPWSTWWWLYKILVTNFGLQRLKLYFIPMRFSVDRAWGVWRSCASWRKSLETKSGETCKHVAPTNEVTKLQISHSTRYLGKYPLHASPLLKIV
jgi:hypothetical protein